MYAQSSEIKTPISSETPKSLEDLLLKNEDLFAATDRELGCTSLVSMEIETGDHPPVALKAYRAPLLKRLFIEDKVDNLVLSHRADRLGLLPL